jgi:hypothetical protein
MWLARTSMSRPLLFTAAAGVVPPALSPALKGTLRRQLALGGRSLRSRHAHLSELRGLHAALRLQSAGDGNFIIVFHDAVLPFQKTPFDCKSLHQPDQEEEEEVNIPGEDLLLDDHYDHSGAKVQNFAQTPAVSLQTSAQTPLSAQFLGGLQAAG